ncbi:MAG: tetratricopeptide repeat protein [Rivularia sp. (in: cyanobacteria)]|jgi:tetratricopeptide (TPR) repeat protein
MKFPFSIPSIIAHTSSILFLGFSLPLLGQITVPDDYHECKIVNPKTFDSAKNILKIAGVPKNCFDLMINQHKKAMASQERWKFYKKAIANQKSGEKQKAILNLNKYIDDNDLVDTEAYIRRGNLYRDLGDKENAIEDYKTAEKILQQHLNGVFGNGGMQPMYKKKLDKVRTELSQLGVSLPEPNLTTADILKSIAEIEVEKAINSARLSPQHPMIRDFEVKLEDLYKQFENTQPQPYKGTAKSLINNAAYRKMDDLKAQKVQLSQRYSPVHPEIVLIDDRVKQLEALIGKNRI